MDKLTGNLRHRTGLFSTLVLQVEFIRIQDHGAHAVNMWRDASVEDLNILGKIKCSPQH